MICLALIDVFLYLIVILLVNYLLVWQARWVVQIIVITLIGPIRPVAAIGLLLGLFCDLWNFLFFTLALFH